MYKGRGGIVFGEILVVREISEVKYLNLEKNKINGCKKQLFRSQNIIFSVFNNWISLKLYQKNFIWLFTKQIWYLKFWSKHLNFYLFCKWLEISNKIKILSLKKILHYYFKHIINLKVCNKYYTLAFGISSLDMVRKSYFSSQIQKWNRN